MLEPIRSPCQHASIDLIAFCLLLIRKLSFLVCIEREVLFPFVNPLLLERIKRGGSVKSLLGIFANPTQPFKDQFRLDSKKFINANVSDNRRAGVQPIPEDADLYYRGVSTKASEGFIFAVDFDKFPFPFCLFPVIGNATSDDLIK